MLFDQFVVDHTEKLLDSSVYAINAVTDDDRPENTTRTPNENSVGEFTREVTITGEAPSMFTNMDKCIITFFYIS